MNRWLGTIPLICAGTVSAHGDHAAESTGHLMNHTLLLLVPVVAIGVAMVIRRRNRR